MAAGARNRLIALVFVFIVFSAWLTWPAENTGLGDFTTGDRRTTWLDSENSRASTTNGDYSEAPKGQAPVTEGVQLDVETRIPGDAVAHGFTLFERLYLRGGTFFVVTSNTTAFPHREHILSRPVKLSEHNDPTDKELQFISPDDARTTLGSNPIPMDGLTVFIYDVDFLRHLYHWWGEILLGFWRIYSKLETTNASKLDAPRRFVVPFTTDEEWRDAYQMDAVLMRAAFPNSPIEASGFWRDLHDLNRTVMFERAAVINRAAAHRHSLGGKWFKMIGSTQTVEVKEGFWRPVRESVVKNILGYFPVEWTGKGGRRKPVVTYISRQQGSRRKLADNAHDRLVDALKKLEEEGLCEVNVVNMETLQLRDQVALLAKTTIVIGVHGNGLTHLLWMPPSQSSAVIEIFNPGGYLFDYEILARNTGHKHYGIWNDRVLSYPQGKYYEGGSLDDAEFQGVNIPVDGETVAKIVRERLA
ncbi:hypothetical protein CYLTODRAFT_486459 [Cylindrobasidium torrendii FP15055 ss-10]|uniref:Glycosyltransferase 61 catalytic domain-containing protein n=1 Tax=Cylindrobasidium torrendii FP15055 ss-10 TaxID=1314674 RepID=A0A0D7BQ00_9AGAR|nr:hypothetical protein CYLTODRAFT_486459 [Cylindrobasidium torrendii FP15055 ss-10]